MRPFLVVPLLLVPLGFGCMHQGRLTPRGYCPPGGAADQPVQCESSAFCPRPPVEVQEVRVKAPPQKVYVDVPCPPMPPGAAPPGAAPPGAAPPGAAPPSPPAAYPPGMMPSAPPGMNLVSANVSGIPQGRAIPALGIDWIRIRIPVPRLFAVPTTPEITLPVNQGSFVGAAMPMVAAYPAAMAPMPGAMPPSCPPPGYAPPGYAPPGYAPPGYAPPSPYGQYNPYGMAPPAPCPTPGASPPTGASAPTGAAPPVTKEAVAEMEKKVQELEKLLLERIRQQGQQR